VLAHVEEAGWGKGKLLAQLHVPRSTYYRWQSQQRQGKLGSSSQNPKIPWNRLSSQEEAVVLANARKYPDLSSQQLAAWITEHQGFSVSEATVYRILRRAGLVKSPELKLLAGKEYHRKTTGPHQLWATDASYFRVVGWGYYYLVTVMDDYSRFVLAWKLQTDMTADSLIEVVQLAVDATGMTEVPAERRWLGLCVPSFSRLPPPGGDPPHPGFTLPSSDQREAGAVPPEHQAGGKPTTLRNPC
jgi:putative transposase